MQHGPLHRRDSPDPAVTDSTLFSVSTSPMGFVPANGGGSGNNNGSQKKKKNKKSLRDRLNLSKRLPGIFKRGKKRLLSETRLRKKLKKLAERGDWDGVRELITGYEFSDAVADVIADHSSPKRGSFSSVVAQEEPPAGTTAARRPSYGSREQRRSFTGSFKGESAAAAAVIKAAAAAALEESSSSHNDSGPHQGKADSGPSTSCSRRPNMGENILHEVCRHCPPLDVLETLLVALRHRRGCLSATDDLGRTPLHLATASGATPTLVDTLVRADPSPASMGDDDRRSPLHLAVRRLVEPTPILHHHHQRKVPLEVPSSPEELLEWTLQTTRILKDAMLTYPGRIDFKDEDGAGFSPLDYVIDSNVKSESLIRTLIRRKEPRCRRSSGRAQRGSGSGVYRLSDNGSFSRKSNLTCGRSIYSAASSVTEDLQDIEILMRLEEDEIEARRGRIRKIKERKAREEHQARMSDALFDVFGIEEVKPPIDEVKSGPSEDPSAVSTLKGSKDGMKPPAIAASMTEADIYHRHLQDYLDVYIDDFEGGALEYDDEDGFDIFNDPEELNPEPSLKRRSDLPIGREQLLVDGIIEGPPLEEIVVAVEDDDCLSLVSEITVPPNNMK